MSKESESKSIRNPNVWMAFLGACVAIAHISAAIWFGMSASNWLSGTAIGLVLLMVAVAHLFIPGHIRGRAVNMQQQNIFWLIAALLGIVSGLVGSLFYSTIGWGVVILGVFAAHFVGRELPGNPKTKAIRLLIFGFATSFTFFNVCSTTFNYSGNEIISFSLFSGVMAILVGLITHLTIGPKLPK